MLGTFLLIILVLILLGGIAPWGAYPGPGHFYGTGYGGGGLGLILLIVLTLFVLGRI